MQQLWEWTQWADANRDGGTAIATNGVVEITAPVLQTDSPAEAGMALVLNDNTNTRLGPVTNDQQQNHPPQYYPSNPPSTTIQHIWCTTILTSSAKPPL